MAKLLIVDDEPDVREFSKNFFKRRKIEVLVAASGEEALELIEKEKPNLVLLDMRMGGIDGLETLSRLRKTGNNVEVIMVTGVNEKEAMEKAKELGACDYIHKPLVLEELEKMVLSRLQK